MWMFVDTGVAPDPQPFHRTLTEALALGRPLALIVHDSAFCEGVSLAPLFTDTPLDLAPGISFRQPYIGLIRADGRALEFTGPAGSQLAQTLSVEEGAP